MEEHYVLEMKNISKSYGDNPVLKDVSLKVKPGEIYALVGENGAGKSTLMNILFGMSVIHETGGFEGAIKVAGKPVEFDTPNAAMEAGIGMVHQEFMLIPGFSITENIKIGREVTRPNLVSRVFGKNLESLNRKQMEKDARKALDTIGMDINQHTLVGGLPVGYMQFVEIAREIDKTGVRILVFDEPTAVLTESEAERLLEVMENIAAQGIAIIFITHRLEEVMNVADNMTVLRDGEVVTSKPISETNVEEIAQLMVGRKIDNLLSNRKKRDDLKTAPVALSLKNFQVDMTGEKVRNANLEVKQGEIFGIGGLAGQGKIGIPNGIMGLAPATGDVEIFGEVLDLDKLGDALQHQVAFVSEDRRGVGLLIDESIENNIVFDAMTVRKDFLRNLGVTNLKNKRAIRKHAYEMIDLLDIRCVGPYQEVGDLSGGNQQKVCLASALTLQPKLLIVSEPTRGIDIGAKTLILDHLEKLRDEQGMTIIMVSSELVELRSICDRIAIVSSGVVTNILAPDASDVEFGLAMSSNVAKEEVS